MYNTQFELESCILYFDVKWEDLSDSDWHVLLYCLVGTENASPAVGDYCLGLKV